MGLISIPVRWINFRDNMTKSIKPSDTYEGLRIQFLAIKRLLLAKEAEVEYYKTRTKEFRVERIIELEAQLASEKEMNAILTEELERGTNF